jgi:peptidylprolyl isomerase
MAVRSKMARIGWLSIAGLFLITSLAGGVYGFWLFTRPSEEPAAEDIASCEISQVAGEQLPEPEAYKPEGDITRLEVEDIEEGAGDAVKRGDCLTVKYHGTLATGEKFDGNFDQPLALKLPIGVEKVIPGWDAGMIGMKAGGTRRLLIPSNLAYGEQGTQGIPPNSDLVFTVKLVSVQ